MGLDSQSKRLQAKPHVQPLGLTLFSFLKNIREPGMHTSQAPIRDMQIASVEELTILPTTMPYACCTPACIVIFQFKK